MNKKTFQSHYDPTRPTVGKIYRDLHLKPGEEVIVGDMSNEVMKGFVDDLNEAILSNPFSDRPFYIMIHEKKDLQMKDALLRRVFKQLWRPYPEDDTTVFWHDPKAFQTKFCWSLPHWSEMYNMIKCEDLYDHAMIEEIKAWRRHDLYPFGFMKDEDGNWKANPHFKDKPIESFRKAA